MGFKEVLNKIKEKKQERKELFRRLKNQDELSNLLEERKKSANERELERYMKEEYEKNIKKQLEIMRKKRDEDIRFNHNPLNVPNITNHVSWEVLKEKNLFNGNGNMFTNQKFIHKSNKKLLKSGNVLHGRNLFKSQRRIFQI